MNFSFLSTFLWVLSFASASKQISVNALVPCENSEGITAKELSVVYDHSSRTIYYNASVTVNFEGLVYADIEVFIYGLKVITTRFDPCAQKNALKQLCPVAAGQIDIESNSVLSESITKHIPGVAFTVPDIDAYAVVKIKDDTTSDLRACVRVEVSNSKSVEQTSVKWVTACLGGLGLFISIIFVFMGTSVDAQSISAVSVLMLQYFQSVVMVDMEAVERVPPIASAWSENLAWSVGLAYAKFLEKIFRWYVQATGGDPATLLLFKTRPVLVQKLKKRAVDITQKISPRALEWAREAKKGFLTPAGESTLNDLSELMFRRDNAAAADSYVKSSGNLIVYRGIERLAFKQKIEVTSAVLTTYTIFIFVCVCVVFVFACLYLLMRWGTSKKRATAVQEEREEKDGRFLDQKSSMQDTYSTTFSSAEASKSRGVFFYALIPSLLKGTILKLWYVAFPSIMVFSMWEWTRVDSAGVVVVSVFMFVMCLVLVLFNVVRLLFIVRKSIRETGSAGYMLYSDQKILQKYGYLYSMFNMKCYWFGMVYLAYNFVKACFLAFAQSSGKTQALAIFIIELAMLITVCVLKPFLSNAVNGIQITAHVVVTLNACFFLFFSNLMTQPLIVNGVMGVVFFVLNAAFSLVLLLYIIIYSILCFIWHRRQGSRPDHLPRDDRNSFIMDNTGHTHGETEELQALGNAAKADHEAEAGAPAPAWFQHPNGSVSASQNPFEPAVVPNPQFGRGEGRNSYSFSDSRTQTMTSENTYNAFNELAPNGHRNAESHSSFALFNQSQNDSTDPVLLGGSERANSPGKGKKIMNKIFKKRR